MPRLPKNYIGYEGLLHRLAKQIEVNNELLLILGSGSSASSNIPTGNQLTQEWIQGIKSEYYPNSSFDEFREELIKDTIGKDGLSPFAGLNNMNQLEYYSQFYAEYHKKQPQNGYRQIEQIIEGATASFGYRYLAELIERDVFKTVLTMNFDNLVESTLIQRTSKVPRVISHESVSEVATYKTNVPTLIKLHRDAYFMPANTSDAIRQAGEVWKPHIKNLLKEKTTIVVGYSGLDEGVVVQALSELKEEGEKVSIYWMIWESASPPKKIKDILPDLDGEFCRFYGFDELMIDLVKVTGNYENLNDVNKHQLLEQKSRNESFLDALTTTLEKALEDRKKVEDFYDTTSSETLINLDDFEIEDIEFEYHKEDKSTKKMTPESGGQEMDVGVKEEGTEYNDQKNQPVYSSSSTRLSSITNYEDGIDWLSKQNHPENKQINYVLKLAAYPKQADELFNQYFTGTDGLIPTGASFGIWMHKQRSYSKSKFILNKMKEVGIKANVIIYTTLISKSQKASDAKKAFDLMIEDSVTPNVNAWSAYIDKLSFEEGFKAYEEMIGYWGIYPNEYTLNALLKNAITPENILKAIRALSEFDIVTNNVMLNLVVKAQKSFKEAHSIFQQLVDDNNVIPDTLEYNTLLSKVENGYQLNAVLLEMDVNGVPKDQRTAKYIVELGLYPEEIIRAIQRIESKSYTDQPKLYCDIIDRMGSFEKAQLIYEFAASAGLTNEYTISFLYSKAEKKSDVDYVEKVIELNHNLVNAVILNLRIKNTVSFKEAVEKFESFRDYENIHPDSYTFTALLSKASSGKEVYSIYKLMKAFNANPTEVHMIQMSRRSTSKPLSKELFEVLDGILPPLSKDDALKMIKHADDYASAEAVGEIYLKSIKDDKKRRYDCKPILEELINKVENKSNFISLLKFSGKDTYLNEPKLIYVAQNVISEFDMNFLKEISSLPNLKVSNFLIRLFPYNVLIQAIDAPHFRMRMKPFLYKIIMALIHDPTAVNDIGIIRSTFDLVPKHQKGLLIPYFELHIGSPKKAIIGFKELIDVQKQKGIQSDVKKEDGRLKTIANAHVKISMANLKLGDIDRSLDHINEAFSCRPNSENDQYPAIVAVHMAKYGESKSPEEINSVIESNYNFVVGRGRTSKAMEFLERFWRGSIR